MRRLRSPSHQPTCAPLERPTEHNPALNRATLLRLTLGRTLLASPNLTDGRVSQIWLGVLVTANTLYVLFVVAGALIVMGHETLQSRYSVKEIAPRLIVGVIASNGSLSLINQLIGIGNALSAALMTGPVSAQGIGNVLTSTLMSNVLLPGSGNLFMLLIGLAIAVLGVVLLVDSVGNLVR